MNRFSKIMFFFVVLSLMLSCAHSKNSGPDPVLLDASVPFASKFIRVAGGAFMMGSPESEAGRSSNEGPQHRVTLKAFFISQCEVTQQEYQELMGINPSNNKGSHLPVEQVTWYDAIEYCNIRSVSEGYTPAYTRAGNTVTWNRNANGYRLPTEAEWEFACRAGTTAPFFSRNSISTDQANYNGNFPYDDDTKGSYLGKTWSVTMGEPNLLGLYNMSGNVAEWCWDRSGSYSGWAETDPPGSTTGVNRVARGGSWVDRAQDLRSAARRDYSPMTRNADLGFRVVRPAS
ncbi:hypothetical protein FACS1894172_01390 [Spirochaetia bacterium]|nr:hypothetical protein FACS1894164_04790 [Spirochaetia bacterium]GHU29704.1 hypothetical protein FACS1894172_01390 [Spirochaetia bacterium]